MPLATSFFKILETIKGHHLEITSVLQRPACANFPMGRVGSYKMKTLVFESCTYKLIYSLLAYNLHRNEWHTTEFLFIIAIQNFPSRAVDNAFNCSY